MSPAPAVRIGDSDREAAVTALAEHYAAGRLTKDEFDERSDQAWAARTAAEVSPLFVDLPRPQVARAPASPGTSRRQAEGHPGWWFGAAMAPVLLVVAALVVLTHLPVFLLVVLAWFFLVRSGRHWACSRGTSRRSHGSAPYLSLRLNLVMRPS